MSKVVKKVGKAIKKVVKGVVKGVKKVWKKVKESKIGRVVLTAALIYFGGAALSGMWAGGSAGSGFMGTLTGGIQGAASGVANAWSGITGATASAVSGNFAQAGSQLAAGAKGQAINTATGTITNAAGTAVGTSSNFAPATPSSLTNAQGQTFVTKPVAGAGNATGTATTTGASANQASTFAGGDAYVGDINSAANAAGGVGAGGVATGGAGGVAGASNPGLIANAGNLAAETGKEAAKAGFFSDPLVKYGTMTVGGGLLSGYAQGAQMQEIENQRRRQEQLAMQNYGENVGTEIGMPVYNPNTGMYEYPKNNLAG
tara:strand:- start:6903 stop:7850 length:948 start_codon:yes stop_codon:yes gene_type:complete